MSAGWTEYILDDVVAMQTTKVDSGFINIDNYISTENMLPEKGGVRRAAGSPEQGKFLEFKKGDVLFSNIRTYFRKVWQASFDGGASNDVIVFRTKNEKILDQSFLYCILADERFIEYTVTTAKGTKMPRGDKSAMKSYELSLPTDINEQKEIAHVLGTLDDKIELNRRMNETLEGMAQAIFKSWFVDFDPVIDNVLANNSEKCPSSNLSQGEGDDIFAGIPEEFMERAETRYKALVDGTASRDVAKAFPNSFQETEEMGWIPMGWEVKPLYDMASFINGAAYKGTDFSESTDALPVIKIAEIKGGITAQTKYTEVNKGDKYKIENGEILLSWSGNPDTSIDTFVWTNGEGYLNQHIFKVFLHDEVDRYFVYYQLKGLKTVFVEIARDKQTTGLGHFTAADMKRIRVFKPTHEMLSLFNEVVAPLYTRRFKNDITTRNLTKLCDTLLPKLISGELKIEDAEKMIKGGT